MLYPKIGSAQLSFDFESSYCRDEIVKPVAGAHSYDVVEWDFCVSSFETPSTVSLLGTLVNGKRILGMDFIEQNGIWYGVATNYSSHTLHLLTFGSGLGSAPTDIKDLGNPDNVLSQPVSIGLLKRDGIVYALVQNWQSSSLARIKFEDGLAGSVRSGSVVSSGIGASLSKMEIVDEPDALLAVVVNSNATLQVVNFQNDIDHVVSVSDISSHPITGATNTRDIEIEQVGGVWYGVVPSSTGKIFTIDFGDNISTGIKGISELVSVNIFGSPGTPNNIELISNGGIYEVHVLTLQGNLYKVKIGSELTVDPISSGSVQYGTGAVYAQGYNLKYERAEGEWFGFAVDDLGSKLYKISSSVDCGSSIGYSNEASPQVSYGVSGEHEISLTGRGTDGSSETVVRTITIDAFDIPQATLHTEGVCISSAVEFNAADLSGNISTWSWDFGDGSGSSDQQTSHQYSAAGTYTVQVAVQDANGCNTSFEEAVKIYDAPTPAFSVPDGVICTNN
ncbi:MAG TPA: PKD domain-containing protein, partial [Chryseosolibacter sp.]|nr:PKD domain-containing protein [Chryseosolibacter sp.]